MNIDEKIEGKLVEIQMNHEWISRSNFIGEFSPGHTLKMNSEKDLLDYSIHTKTEELLELEYEILLDEKYVENTDGEQSKRQSYIHELRNEIATLKLELEA